MAGVDDASSSSPSSNDDKPSCFHCKNETTTFIDDWKLSNGTFAQLRDHCGSVYENGTFCETFHKEYEGRRDCVVCKKMLHCGCIMSNKVFHLLDYGGVCCNDCAKKLFLPRHE